MALVRAALGAAPSVRRLRRFFVVLLFWSSSCLEAGEAEVAQHPSSLLSEKHVLWLDVAMTDRRLQAMEMSHGAQYVEAD